MYDIKILNGKILDFYTGEEYIKDIGIKDGKIKKIGNIKSAAKKEIDASGKIVSPGFIDIHMHEETIKDTLDENDYDIANKMILMGVTTCIAGNCGNNRQEIKDFFTFIDKYGAPVNYLAFSGHNYLRNKVGVNRYERVTNLEIEKIKKLALNDLNNGAIGLSFGLEYSPGTTKEEVIDISSSFDEDILLSAHFRKDAKYGIPSVKELIEISKETKKPMQISHLGSCTGFGMMDESLDIISKAIDDGVDIKADCYPYNAFSTFIGSAVFDEGCFKLWNKSYDSILLTEKPYKGIRCDEKLFYKVRKENPEMLVIAFVMEESDIIKAMKAPFVMIASDGLYKKEQGHPRGAGTFPRVLGHFVREKNELKLYNALRKITLEPAKRLGLNKGEISEGLDADIVIFDPDIIIDKATFENPTLPPRGIDYVIINGEIAVKDNNIFNDSLGRVIRRDELKGIKK
ncbi:MAG: amidohydrolase family protein [Firmicutes bacterium]|nr:amidohydrolase family protein [Bacillota bacterium]